MIVCWDFCHCCVESKTGKIRRGKYWETNADKLNSLNEAQLWNSCNLSAPDKMPIQIKNEIQLEIAHVMFIDIVGYSKLSINDQHAAVEELTRIVRASEEFQRAEAASRLTRIPQWACTVYSRMRGRNCDR
jgi:hypothetical protein